EEMNKLERKKYDKNVAASSSQVANIIKNIDKRTKKADIILVLKIKTIVFD
ncbi:2550_t:CDS:1, partial [Cetraspora pellucida]